MGFSYSTKIILGVLLAPLVFLTLFFLVLSKLGIGFEWIFSDVATISSYRFSSLFLNSYIIVITLLILLSISILYKPIKESSTIQIVKRCILCLVIFTITLVPFSKGYDMNKLYELGYRLVQNINQFHLENNRYPDELFEIQEELTFKEKELMVSNFRYYVDSEGKYVLKFIPDDKGMLAYYYYKSENKFIGSD